MTKRLFSRRGALDGRKISFNFPENYKPDSNDMLKIDKGAVLASAAALTSSLACAAQPNVVFILADDMGYGDVSALNENSRIRTPAIDALCREGVVFTDAHAASSVSTPSRYGILTGRYAFRTTLKNGVTNSYSPPLIASDRRTIATVLAEQGYETACIGKWHLGWNWTYGEGKKVDFSRPIANGPTARGFGYFFGIAASLDMPPYVYIENDRVTAAPDRVSTEGRGILLQRSGPQGADFEHGECLQRITRQSLEYIGRQSRKKPFFLYMPLTAPHTPILPSEEFRGRSGLSPYGDFVMMVDDAVAQVVARLKEQGLYENTLIVFTTDNGCYHGAGVREMEAAGHYPSYIYRGYKSDLYDGGHRVPLVVSWGGRKGGRVERGLTSLTDFYATFAEMTGYRLTPGEGEDSYSLWGVITGKGRNRRPDAVHHSIDGSFSLREGRWKLLFAGGSGGWSFPTLPKDREYIAVQPAMQLYDLESDPAETKNVIAEHPEIAERLTDRMREYIERGRSTPGPAQTNENSREWKQTALFM